MKSKFLLLSAILFSVVLGQTNNDWNCDHYTFYPTDICLPLSSSYTYKYTCNGTDTIRWDSWTDVDDCESGDDPTSTYQISLDAVNGDFSECDNGEPCGYYSVVCDDSTYVFLPVGVCYSFSSNSVYYDCSGSDLIANVYTTNDCTGSSTCGIIDYTNTYTDASCQVKK